MNKIAVLPFLVLGCAAAFAFKSVPQSTNPSSQQASRPEKFAAAIGQPAPSFSLKDTKGEDVSLSDYAGKFVVLEWTNHTCPYVKKHYNSGNMQSLQKWAKDKGVVWLTVISSAPGNQGYETPAEGQELIAKEHADPTAKLIDADGTVGHLYGAKNTPDMRIIDPKGVLIYSGAIDDKATPDLEDVKTAHNYVKAALEEALAGKPVTTPTAQPYGCSIKYAS